MIQFGCTFQKRLIEAFNGPARNEGAGQNHGMASDCKCPMFVVEKAFLGDGDASGNVTFQD